MSHKKSERSHPFRHELLRQKWEIFNENHIRHGAGWRRHSHSSLLFYLFYRSLGMLHVSLDDRSEFFLVPQNLIHQLISSRVFLIAFFGRRQKSQEDFRLVEILPNRISIICCPSNTWVNFPFKIFCKKRRRRSDLHVHFYGTWVRD